MRNCYSTLKKAVSSPTHLSVISVLLLCLFFNSSSAWAFWFGSIPSDNTALKEAPSDGSKTVETMAQGTRFTSVDQPADGYYRIRTKTGTGYVEASIIDSQNPKQSAAGAATTAQPPGGNTPAVKQVAETSAPVRRPPRRRRSTAEDNKWSISVIAGLHLSNPSDVSSAIGTTSLSDPLGLGFELAYRIKPDWRLAFRAEYIAKGLTGTNTKDSNTYQLEMKGYMFTVGADYFFTSSPRYDFYGGLRAGLGMGKLSSVATNLASPNETDFSGSALAGSAELGSDLKVWSFLWFGGEVGYQLFKTGETAPSYPGGSSSGNGALIWPNPITLSFSGIFLNLNVRILF